MKKIVFVLLMAFFFNAFHISAQDNITVIDVDGIKINIPLPEKQFVEIDIFKLGAPKYIASPFDKLYCTFIDSSDYANYLNKEYKNVNMNNLILIGDYKEDKITFEDESFFEDERKEDLGTLSKDMNQMLDSINFFFDNTNSAICIANDEYPKEVGCILDITNAYGLLMCNFIKDQSIIKKMLIINIYIKVKEKILALNIFRPFNGYESIKWSADISDKWANQILDANE